MKIFFTKIISLILAFFSIFNPTPDKGNDAEQPNQPEVDIVETYEVFNEELNVYEHKNLDSVGYSEYDCAAWLSVYKTDNTSQEEFKCKFEECFGFQPTYEIKCESLGKFIIDGYAEPQEIFHYYIEDYTYPLLKQDFYVIERKICTDGSPWVGFPVSGDIGNMEYCENFSQLVQDLEKEFYDWTGYDREFINANRDKFTFHYLSQAGYMRTDEGQVVQVVFWYIRAYGLPIESLENRT